MSIFWVNRQDAIKFKQDTAIRDVTPDEMKEASSKLVKFSGQPAKIDNLSCQLGNQLDRG
jgi:hypothetical protein